MKIRLARETDLEQWMDLVHKMKENFPGLETEQALLEHQNTVSDFIKKESAICADCEGNLVGALLFEKDSNTLCFLAVDASCQRQHIGRQMVSYMLTQLDPTKHVTVTTYREGAPEGVAARAFYKSLGFVEGRLTEAFGSPVQEFVLLRQKQGFKRKNQFLSLCGLNCGLCPMRLGGHCGGCGNGNQSCKLARCSLEHGEIEYCYECRAYPCEHYRHIDQYDSFITHRRQKADLEKVKIVGIEKYNLEQQEKVEILSYLLSNYNDGRKKNFFCVAVNLLELSELQEAVKKIQAEKGLASLSPKMNTKEKR